QGVKEVADQTLLFDTGAQLTVVSTDIALGLGLDLDNPSTSLTVQGAAGQVSVPGFTVDALELPRDDNGDGVIDGVLQFSQAPIYVLDVVEGLDGLIGMNLFNTAKELLYDPHDPDGASLQLTFFTDLVRELPDPEELAAVDFLADSHPVFRGLDGVLGGGGLPSFGIDPPPQENQPPVAEDDPAETEAGTAIVIDVLQNDSDPDGDPLNVIAASDPVYGAVVVNGDNTIAYTPDAGFAGTDAFTYTVSDGNGGEAAAAVTVTVTAGVVNHAPTAIALSHSSVDEASPGAEVGAVTVADPDAADTHVLTVSDGRFEIVAGVLKLKDNTTLDFESAPSMTVEITAADSGSPPKSITQSFTISVVDTPEAVPLWQNPQLRWDVDDDGEVAINDLLAIVQALRREGGPHPTPATADGENAPPPYVDVNGDDSVSLADLLDTVQKIRTDAFATAEAEGEPTSAVDAVFALDLWDPSRQGLHWRR
ncbi:MAG: cadherin-like domain-containing protein, partial [Planctomycetes bacterium]|nr:cadherin-like domain-containing protein [Planctomycetota bacterium]